MQRCWERKCVQAALSGPTGLTVINQGATADGSGWVYGPGFYPVAENTPFDYQIVVQTKNGSLSKADLGQRLIAPVNSLENTFDVAVVP